MSWTTLLSLPLSFGASLKLLWHILSKGCCIHKCLQSIPGISQAHVWYCSIYIFLLACFVFPGGSLFHHNLLCHFIISNSLLSLGVSSIAFSALYTSTLFALLNTWFLVISLVFLLLVNLLLSLSFFSLYSYNTHSFASTLRWPIHIQHSFSSLYKFTILCQQYHFIVLSFEFLT